MKDVVDYQKELADIEVKFDRAKVEKIKAEERLKQCNDELEKAKKELEGIGVPFETADKWLQETSIKIEEGLKECQALLQ